ncbi:MAG TPA: HupE/UreJ family protein [Steroidobacteraceae bacterium]|jgi:hydrogenase/urease accessory protein HupE|nr:HupE/UreJ family protein [Steroidobacteraceae bacterium]
MNRRWMYLAVLLIGFSGPAWTHRLDQYLQATTITLAKERVTLRLRLTPGVSVAGQVLGAMSVKNGGRISDAAQRAYWERVRQDLALTIDGVPLSLRLIDSSFDSAAQLRSGIGEIAFTFDAAPPPGPSPHHLTFTNVHQNAIAAYLVNCFVPADPGIRILAQRRSVDQSSYQLDYAIGGATSVPAPVARQLAAQDGRAVIKSYFIHGVRHILTGYDHLLFAVALVLAVTTLWDLVKVVTAFTVAHSITLTLAALGLIHVSERVVEPVIAASIVCVALQNVYWPKSARAGSRLAVAFIFGLFHGLGFAGGLLDLMHRMPEHTALLAILGFSIGVEAGHQVVLLPLFGLLKIGRRARNEDPGGGRRMWLIQQFGSATIAVVGICYLAKALMVPQ